MKSAKKYLAFLLELFHLKGTEAVAKFEVEVCKLFEVCTLENMVGPRHGWRAGVCYPLLKSSRNLTIWKYERAKSWSARWRASVCAPLLWKHRLEKLTRIWPEKRICHICEGRKEVKWGIRRQNGERVKTLRRSSCLIRRRYQFLREGGAGICEIQRTRSTKKSTKIPFWIDYVLMIAIHAHLYDGVDDDDIEEFNNKTPSDSFSQLLRGLWQASLFDNFQHFTFLFVSIFPALIWFSLKSRIGWYLSETFSKGCENEVELGAVVAHGKLDQAC